MRVKRKWKMINIQVTLRLGKPNKTFRKISEIVRKDMSVRMIADMVGINRGTVRQTLRNKRPNQWKNNVGMLHQDNAPAHNALLDKKFLPDKHIPVLEHPSYSWIFISFMFPFSFQY